MPAAASRNSGQKRKLLDTHDNEFLHTTTPSDHESKRRGLFSSLIHAGVIQEHQSVSYLRRKDGTVLKHGVITREGVLCSCCGNVFLLAKFEAHAGSNLHRPSDNMFLQDGRSITECKMQAWAGDESKEGGATDDNENFCRVCGDGGWLILCDSCPAAFHSECIDLHSIPVGEWYCSTCRTCQVHASSRPTETLDNNDSICRICLDGGELLLCDGCPFAFHAQCINLDTVPEGNWYCSACQVQANDSTNSGVIKLGDNIEKSMEAVDSGDKSSMPIEIVDNSDNICQICGYGGKLILCDACPSAFHAQCMDLKSVPEGIWHCSMCRCGHCRGIGGREDMICCVQCDVLYHCYCRDFNGSQIVEDLWFCSHHCKIVFLNIRFLVGVIHPLENGLSWTLLRSPKEDKGRLSMDNKSMAKHQKKLCKALHVLRDCFDPILDDQTETELLEQVVFNRKSSLRRINCSGFYTIVLHRSAVVISVAAIRIHRSKLAEMPFIGTRYEYRNQGMCRQLMCALEKMLVGAGVHQLILPSVPDLVKTWISAFKFTRMNSSNRKQVSHFNLMPFPGTIVLHKHLLNSNIPASLNAQSNKQLSSKICHASLRSARFRLPKLHQPEPFLPQEGNIPEFAPYQLHFTSITKKFISDLFVQLAHPTKICL